jgi:hypothetical protein
MNPARASSQKVPKHYRPCRYHHRSHQASKYSGIELAQVTGRWIGAKFRVRGPALATRGESA